MRLVWALVCVGLLVGCVSKGSAPVVDKADTARIQSPPAVPVSPRIEVSTTGFHVIARGDTLYAIAFANGLDFREIATWNQLDNPDRILVGQRLRLTPPPGAVEIKPLGETLPLQATPLGVPLDDEPVVADVAPRSQTTGNPAQNVAAKPSVSNATVASARVATPTAGAPDAGWKWPADGVLAARFGGAGGKGIDIVAPRLTEVRAASAGKVVYSGNGLRGYGRLLIIKHAGDFLSAYAHNDSVLVKEGDSVGAGQVIARMGDSDSDRVKLHFEIRRYGKPLDPLVYLPERS